MAIAGRDWQGILLAAAGAVLVFFVAVAYGGPSILTALSMFQYNHGHFEQAAFLIERALSVQEAMSGRDSPDVARTLMNLAAARQGAGDFPAAERAIARAVTLVERRKVDSSSYALALSVYWEAARLFQEGGRPEEAAGFFDRAIAVQLKEGAADSQTGARLLSEAGDFHLREWELEKAESLFRRALKLVEADPEPDDETRVIAWSGLGCVESENSNFRKAEQCFQRALETARTGSAAARRLEADVLNSFAACRLAEGRAREAVALYEEALAQYRSQPEADSHWATAIKTGLARALAANGEAARAELLVEEVLKSDERDFGSKSRELMNDLIALASTCRSMGRQETASSLLKRARAIARERFATGGDELERECETMDAIAESYAAMGLNQQAADVLNELLSAYKTRPNVLPSATIELMTRLAWAESALGRDKEAEKHARQALGQARTSLVKDHELTAEALHLLGLIEGGRGADDEARASLEQALAIREKALGYSHSDTVSTLSALAALYASQGLSDDCERLYKRFLEKMPTDADFDEEALLVPLEGLARQYSLAGRYDQARPLLKRYIDTASRLYGPDDEDVVDKTLYLAGNCRAAKRYLEAERIYRSLLAANQDGSGRPAGERSRALSGLGLLYLDMKRNEEGISMLKQAVQSLEKSGELQAREGGLALCRLAAGYAMLGKAGLADTYYKQGLQVLENVLQKQPVDLESAAVIDEYGAFMGKESLSVAADSPAGKAGRKRRQ